MNKKIEDKKKKFQKEQMITEYVETGEGSGISIISLNEKEANIDGKQLITDNIDGQQVILY